MLSQLHTIKEWTHRPSEFGLCKPENDLAFMMAHDAAWAKMQNYEYEQIERKTKSKGKRFE